jgi:membrane protease YdiL (CAAX protease family)
MDVTASKNKTNLLLLSVTIYLCTLLLVGINRTPYISFSPYFIVFYNSLFCFLIYIFANPFKWTKESISSRKLSDKFYNLKRTIVIVIMILLIISKSCFVYYVNHNILPEGEFNNDRKIINLIMFIPAGFFEEMFFKGLLLRLFKTLKLNDVISYIVISLLFALAHLVFSIAFIPLFFISFFSLLLFRLFPSIILFSIVHILWNISTFI